MSTFEYVSVIFSVVVSLAFIHLLAGIVRLIHARGVKFSFVHAAWTALLVFWCIDYWFSIWHLREAEVWTRGFVSFLLLMATVLYVACGLAAGGERDHGRRGPQRILRYKPPPVSERALRLSAAQYRRQFGDRASNWQDGSMWASSQSSAPRGCGQIGACKLVLSYSWPR